MTDALEYTKKELQKELPNVTIILLKTKPNKEFTGTVLLAKKNNTLLRFVKEDKFSYEIAKYTLNGKHTTIGDMMEDLK